MRRRLVRDGPDGRAHPRDFHYGTAYKCCRGSRRSSTGSTDRRGGAARHPGAARGGRLPPADDRRHRRAGRHEQAGDLPPMADQGAPGPRGGVPIGRTAGRAERRGPARGAAGARRDGRRPAREPGGAGGDSRAPRGADRRSRAARGDPRPVRGRDVGVAAGPHRSGRGGGRGAARRAVDDGARARGRRRVHRHRAPTGPRARPGVGRRCGGRDHERHRGGRQWIWVCGTAWPP